ncbi:MAG: DUF1294 domain-containing protein [Bacilli bacterium]|nr:DUF1294 domain-containing protein [Bacilli bacterium]
MTLKQIILLAYGGYLILLSLITFILYFADKKKAEKKKWRIPEKVLLLSSFLGGAFGGYPAMLLFRHKTKGEHWYFTFINILGLLIHIAALVAIAFFIKFE